MSTLPLQESPGWSYLLKQSAPDVATVVRAIQGSVAGMVVLDPAVVEALMPARGSTVSRLTPRQQEVLELIAQGFTNAGIAEHLGLAEKSIESYVNAIYQQLQISGRRDVHSRVKATLYYLEQAENRR